MENDTGGWQWTTSMGITTRPSFSVFESVTYSERYGPDAVYR
ncbi:FAD-binding domain-containing protein [Halalkalicoccus subterraneus]|nr:FAD-binding domain-containing protein [Halalkalicoccus subterraneus]